MEACGSAHHWGHELMALGRHEVKLTPPVYVKPFVRRQKNDTAAICLTMRRCGADADFVPIA
jgi:transposase